MPCAVYVRIFMVLIRRLPIQGLMNFLGTHDTPRILSVLGDPSWEHCTRGELAQRRLSSEAHTYAKKLLKLAFLILFGMPGVPCVFYGDEAGMEGYDDPFNRRPYPWHTRDMELLKYVTTLGTFRKSELLLQLRTAAPVVRGYNVFGVCAL